MPDNAPNLEQIAGATPPIAPQPAPQPVPSLYDGLRVRLAPFVAAADAATGGALSTGATMAKNLGSQVKDIATDPTQRRDFIHGTLVGMASGGEFGEDVPAIYEGLRVRKADTPNPSKLAKDAGLVYKDEAMKGSGVHQFEHPDHPNETMAVREKDLSTPEDLKARMDAKLAEKPIVPKVTAEPPEKKLPPVGNNYRTDLSKFTDTLHHETNVYRALEMLPTGRVIADQPDMYFANTPELATGQGMKKGVHLEFDSRGIQGQVNLSKPMAKAAYDQGSAEFWSKINDQQTLQKNLKSVTIKKDAQVNSRGEKFSMDRALAGLEQQGWTKTKTSEGVRYERPAVTSTNASGESAASQEAINRLAAEKLGGVKRVRIDTRSGKESVIPPGVDAVDMKAGPWEKIVRRDAKGDTLLDKGARVRDAKK